MYRQAGFEKNHDFLNKKIGFYLNHIFLFKSFLI